MRRAIVVTLVLGLLGGSCGDPSNRLDSALRNRVASIREAAEAGHPGIAIGRLNTLVDLVSNGLENGSIDQARAFEILEAAEAVQSQLALFPRPSPEPSPTPTEEEGDHDEGGGKGKDKGKDKGHGDEGHGHD